MAGFLVSPFPLGMRISLNWASGVRVLVFVNFAHWLALTFAKAPDPFEFWTGSKAGFFQAVSLYMAGSASVVCQCALRIDVSGRSGRALMLRTIVSLGSSGLALPRGFG